jgi:hypothetical protein
MNVQYKLAFLVPALLMSNFSLADVKEISLQEIQGNLVVDSGGSRFLAYNGAVLKVDDSAIMPANAGGKIVGDNFTFVLEPKTVVKVLSDSGEFEVTPYGTTEAASGTPNSVTENVTGYNLSNVLGVAAIVGGAAAFAAYAGRSGGSRDASPQ